MRQYEMLLNQVVGRVQFEGEIYLKYGVTYDVISKSDIWRRACVKLSYEKGIKTSQKLLAIYDELLLESVAKKSLESLQTLLRAINLID